MIIYNEISKQIGGGFAHGEMSPEDILNMLFHGVPPGYGRQQQYAQAQQRRQRNGKLKGKLVVLPP